MTRYEAVHRPIRGDMKRRVISFAIPHRPLAVIRNWQEFRQACRARCDELRVARTTVDEVGGFPSGQTAKLIAPLPPQGFGTLSFSSILGALGLAVVVVEDAEALARIRHRLLPREECKVRASDDMLPTKRRRRRHSSKKNPDWARIMNDRRKLILSPKKRKQIAENAARIRWSKPTVTEIKG